MKRLLPSLVACAAACLALAVPAQADFGLEEFDVRFSTEAGDDAIQAGSHPFAVTTSFEVNTEEVEGIPLPSGFIKDLEIFQAPGFIGDLTAVPPCSTLDFLTIVPGNNLTLPNCPNSTAVGVIEVILGQGDVVGPIGAPLYNLEPSPGKAAKLGFIVQEVPVTIDIGLAETPPYNVLASSRNITQVLEFLGGDVVIWGVPADKAHDEERGSCFENSKKETCPAGIAARPFITLPRSCEGPLETRYELDPWENPGAFVKGSTLSEGMLGCGNLSFGPTPSAQPSSTSAESSSGLDFNIDVNDEGLKNPAPEARAQADISKLLLRLPVGVTANPSAAEGLGVCSKAQYEAEGLQARGCPEESKLGSLEAETPLLENHPLRGSIYLAQQDDPSTSEPEAENPFDSLLAIYFVVRDPELGIFVKLASKVEPDPATGQLLTSTEDIPPFPLSRVNVHLRSGPRAPLITPPSCGTYTSQIELTPSSGAPPLKTSSSFEITSGPGGGPCPAGGTPPFAPGFEAGSENNAAGHFSPFSMRLTRADGEQDLTRFSAALPPGVVPSFVGVAKCPDGAIEAAKLKTGRAELASPSCPASSQVGSVIGGAGVGTALTYVRGSLYLAGPYNGAPLSVVSVVPAVAGPFDVGTVVTRVALKINPLTWAGEVDGAASDPIPHILKGLPLKIRDVRVEVDRPNFTKTPTGCAEKQTVAEIFGGGTDVFSPADDVSVSRSSRYQAASCASLAFKPKLTLALKGGTKRDDHPALTATLRPRAGDANVGRAVAILPHTEFIDPDHINNPCTRVQYNAGTCPPASVLGRAIAISPLLEEPLEGPIYFRTNGGERLLPDIVVDLRGLFNIPLVGFVDSTNARIRTTFASLPDAAATKVVLKFKGGKQGVLVNSANLCAQKRYAKVKMTAQNGRRQESNTLLKTSCKANKRQKRGR